MPNARTCKMMTTGISTCICIIGHRNIITGIAYSVSAISCRVGTVYPYDVTCMGGKQLHLVCTHSFQHFLKWAPSVTNLRKLCNPPLDAD